MILSLVAEGRTVVLSSHLLDEVERTCDAVAIVDRGSVVRQGPISELLAGASLDPRGRVLRSRSGQGAHHRDRHRCRRGRTSRSKRPGWASPCRQGPGATWSPRSTVCSSTAGSRSTGSRWSRPRSNRGSCRSRADWGNRNDDGCPKSALRRPPRRPPRREAGPPGIVDPGLGHDHHPVHGAAQASRPHDRPDRGDHRHPHGVPGHPAAAPRLRAAHLRAGGRLLDLHGPRVGCAVRLRLHRRRHPGCHRGIRRPVRGDVPTPGGDRPLAPGALSGPDPRRPGHHRDPGGGGLHHRLHRVRVRGADPAGLRRRERARRPVACRPRELGRRPRQRGRLQLQHQYRTVDAERSHAQPGGQRRPVRQRTRRAVVKQGPAPQGQPQPSQAQISARGCASWPTRTTPTTPGSSCTRRPR